MFRHSFRSIAFLGSSLTGHAPVEELEHEVPAFRSGLQAAVDVRESLPELGEEPRLFSSSHFLF